jgi:hypothetical protein
MDGGSGRRGSGERWPIWLLLAAALQGCTLRSPGEAVPPGGDCVLDPGEGAWRGGPGVPVVGVTDPVDPAYAPVGRSDGESLLFATLHPPLLRLDCSGRLGSGLVREWTSSDSGRSWLLFLEPRGMGVAEARRRGTAVAARLRAPEAWGGGEMPRSVEFRPPGQVVVTFARPPVDGAGLFALPGLAPVPVSESAGVRTSGGPPPDSLPRWVPGFSGLALEREPVLPPERGGVLRLHRVDGGSMVARIRVVPGGDPRDLVDEGAALVLTRDPVAVEWGRGREDIRVVPLPSDRLHLLAVPTGVVASLPTGFREALARDVVPGSSPGDPRGWLPGATCPGAGGAGPPSVTATGAAGSSSPGRVVFMADDPVARLLAERVAALAGPGGDPALRPLGDPGGDRRPGAAGPLQVAALSPGAFEAALRAGGETAYILALPLSAAAPCRAREELGARAPWLGREGALLALVETGATALARDGAPLLELDGLGRVRLLPGGAP